MKRHGVVTVLDPNIRPLYLKDKPDFKPRLLKWISEADILKASDDDLAWITGETDVGQALQKLPYNKNGLVVITEGAKGARALWREEVAVAGFKVEVAETTGCGDAFMAGMMHGLTPFADDLAQLDIPALREILRFANACAAIVATRRGAANSMPRLEEVEAFLRSRSIS